MSEFERSLLIECFLDQREGESVSTREDMNARVIFPNNNTNYDRHQAGGERQRTHIINRNQSNQSIITSSSINQFLLKA